MPNPKLLALRARQALVALLALAFFAAGAGYLLVRHVLWPQAPRLLPQAVASVSEALGQPVAVGAARTGWHGLRPALTLHDVALGAADAPQAARALRVDAVLSWRSLLLGAPRFSLLRIEGARLHAAREPDGAWRVAGLRLAPEAGDGRGALRWLLAQRRIELAGARIELSEAAGGATLVAEGVDGTLRNAGRGHRFRLHAARLQRLGAAASPDRPADADGRPVGHAIEAAGDFLHPPHVPAAHLERWSGAGYASVGWLDLATLGEPLRALAPALRADGPLRAALPEAGVLAAQAWLDVTEGRLADATFKVGGSELRWPAAAGAVRLTRLRLDARTARDDGAQWWWVRELEAREAGGARLAGAREPLQARLDASGRLAELALRVDELDLGATLALAGRLPLPQAVRARLQQLDASGRLLAPRLQWQAPEPGGAGGAGDAAAPLGRYAFEARFEALALAAREAAARAGRPGFANLSGRVSATQAGGRVVLDARRATLVFPGVFAEPAVPLARLAGAVGWTAGHDGLPAAAETTRLAFANADAAGELSGSWRRAGAGPGVVDLTARLDQADAARTARYLPLKVPQKVRDWVEQAIVAGRSDRVDVRLRGDLRDFPYRSPQAGEFRVAARLREAALRYAPEWPAIEAIAGQLVFERAGMRVAAESARVHRVALSAVSAAIDDLAEPLLRIEGQAAGAAQDMLRFVNDSPVGERIDRFVADAVASGTAALDLALQLPLREPQAGRVQGTVRLAGNSVALHAGLPRLEAVSGRIAFTESSLALHDLRAGFLGGQAKISGQTVEPGWMRLQAEGSASAEALGALADHPVTRRLSGTLGYRASLDARRHASALRVESDLIGLAVDLPAPFGKPAGSALPLRVEAQPAGPFDARGRPAGDLVTARLGPAIRVALERGRGSDEQLHVRRAAFAVGADPVLPDRGLAVLIAQPRLDLDAWHALLAGEIEAAGQGGARTPDEAFSPLPSTVSVVAQQLRLAGKDLHDVVLGASRTGGLWRANVSSREIDGFFNWREAGAGQAAGTLTARFARLEIPRSRAAEVESLLDSPPERLPGLDIAADEFVLGERALGRLVLRATNGGAAAAPVWRLERLALGPPGAQLEATGRWARAPGARARSTQLAFELRLDDAGALLDRLGVHGAIRGGRGQLAGEVAWQGSPLSIDYPSLAGQVGLGLAGGQFLKADPGLAKLIGVLNLQSLPRRLTFDFRDVFSEGFAFDRIDGDVRIERGIAHTDNFRMRGVQATVGIRGQADLARETQSLQVRVLPELNAGLASLAYAALANPVIGLGSFVAQWLMRRPLQEAFAYDVEVQGSWADPVVRPVARTDRLEPAGEPGLGPAPAAPAAGAGPAAPAAAVQENR